jgi:hypothetical protein
MRCGFISLKRPIGNAPDRAQGMILRHTLLQRDGAVLAGSNPTLSATLSSSFRKAYVAQQRRLHLKKVQRGHVGGFSTHLTRRCPAEKDAHEIRRAHPIGMYSRTPLHAEK